MRKGFTCLDHYVKMGLHSSNTTELVLENVRVPDENILGKVAKGLNSF